jgi:hypothetical protein
MHGGAFTVRLQVCGASPNAWVSQGAFIDLYDVKALFSSQKFLDLVTIPFLFLFGN